MPRSPRLDPAGAWQHVTNRGGQGEALFQGAADRLRFLEILVESGARHGVEVHAYALMERHFHLLLRSRRGRLSEAMRQLQQGWSVELGRRGGDGPVFRARFRSQILVSDEHLGLALRHVHQNPLRALCHAPLDDASLSSLPVYLGRAPRPRWLHVEALGALATGPDPLGLLEAPSRAAPLDGLVRPPPGARVEAARVEAEALAGERQPSPVLEAVRALTGADLAALQRGGRGPAANPARRFAVWALRQHTDLSQAEIAGLLAMSTRQVQNVELRLRRGATEPVAGWVRRWVEEGRGR